MALIEWNSKMSIGVKEIDEQHLGLVKIINRLHEALVINTYDENIDGILMELVEYTKYHFRSEEKLMELNNYNDLENHRKMHNKFVERISRLAKRTKDDSKNTSIDLSSYLSGWLIGHILHSDKDFANSIVVQN